jgi:lipopolysaccharide transport system ATP-binding protein
MSDIAIHLEGISKRYRIGAKRQKYQTLRDTLTDAAMTPFRRLRALLTPQPLSQSVDAEMIWALKDVSLDIGRGEVVGIIGRNGAGKSTLLKILSRITEPTQGLAEIRGRVSSLLEVGTGFHPELTGRENIYLNAAILGMKRAEIDRKFDEIVAFAEVEKFVDTPVKRYSSGMQLRIAFAVAAHLEPEILVIDEVLAVGDTRFQKKCMNKMEEVGQHGRTVLFVSHNLPSVTRLCKRAILLDAGTVLRDGPAHQVASAYLNSEHGTMAAQEWPDPMRAPGREIARLRAVRVRTEDGKIADAVDIRYAVSIEMEYEVLKAGYVLLPHYHFYNDDGICSFISFDLDPVWRRRPRPVGRYISTAWIPGNLLAEGMVFVEPWLITVDPIMVQFRVSDAVGFQVIDSVDGDSARGDFPDSIPGVVRPLLKWTTQVIPTTARLAV